MSQAFDAELLVEISDGIAVATLNRPKALNALTHEMVIGFGNYLRTFAADPAIRAVVVRGAGDKAFCAGGDIRKLYDARATGPVQPDFFYDEYVMNTLIHHFPKPYIALLDGITMGGGVGISAPGRYRVATERLMWAMPETGIGLFPDVGGSYFLPRLPGKIGLYLGLTGYRLKAADALYTGVATHNMSAGSIDAFISVLRGGTDIDTALKRFSADAGPAPLAKYRADIDRLFAGTGVEAIMADLASEGSEWAAIIEATLKKMSPTSLKLTYAAYYKGALLSFDDVMKMEFRIVSHLMAGHDFFEGVRALLVDRDNAPEWHPSRLSEVAEADIDAYFAPKARELKL